MPHTHAIAFNDILARLCDIEQQINEMILEQIHFVDVEKTAVRARQQSGLERLLAIAQRFLDIERADHAILSGAEWQVDDRHTLLCHRQLAARDVESTFPAFVAARAIRRRVAAIATPLHRLHAWQERRQRTDDGRFSRAAISKDKDAAHGRIDGRNEERQLHLLLTDNCTERKSNAHTIPGIR